MTCALHAPDLAEQCTTATDATSSTAPGRAAAARPPHRRWWARPAAAQAPGSACRPAHEPGAAAAAGSQCPPLLADLHG